MWLCVIPISAFIEALIYTWSLSSRRASRICISKWIILIRTRVWSC